MRSMVRLRTGFDRRDMRYGACVALVSLWWCPACSSNDEAVPVPVSDAAVVSEGASAPDASTSGADASGPGASASSGGAAAAGGAQDAAAASEPSTSTAPATADSLVRFANWSPDSPAIDVCIAPHGTTSFQGPIVSGLATSTASVPAALAFPYVSAYAQVTPGEYDVRIVVGGAPDCSQGVVPDATDLPGVAAGAAVTMALVGEAAVSGSGPGLELVPFTDDIASASVLVRFINAAPTFPQVDFGTGTLAGTYTPLLNGVAFAAAGVASEALDGSASSIDRNGYENVGSLSDTTLSAHAPGGATDIASATGLSAASATVLTVALVGGASSDILSGLLVCVDNAGTAGSLSNCCLASSGLADSELNCAALFPP